MNKQNAANCLPPLLTKIIVAFGVMEGDREEDGDEEGDVEMGRRKKLGE
jgi:hypothetical protein